MNRGERNHAKDRMTDFTLRQAAKAAKPEQGRQSEPRNPASLFNRLGLSLENAPPGAAGSPTASPEPCATKGRSRITLPARRLRTRAKAHASSFPVDPQRPDPHRWFPSKGPLSNSPSSRPRKSISRAAARHQASRRETEAVVDLAGGVAFVERVEVDAVDAFVEQVGALLGGIVDAHALDRFGIDFARAERPDQLGGEARAGGEFRHALHAWKEVTGITPAMIGTWMPARSQRSRKSKKSWLSKNSWVQM